MALDGKTTSEKLRRNYLECSDWQPCRLLAAMFNNGLHGSFTARCNFNILISHNGLLPHYGSLPVIR